MSITSVLRAGLKHLYGPVLGLGLSLCQTLSVHAQSHAARPNIVVIVADDLGYSDLSAFGSEISTPNLDTLLRNGLQLTNFHVSPTCSPTRAMLMSGTDNHVAGLGSMAEEMVAEQRGHSGYEGYLNDKVVAFPALLRDGGYHTYMAGKWHLGLKPENSPAAHGFERSFALLNGGASHFDQTGLAFFAPKAMYSENGRQVDLPKEFHFSSDYYTDRIIGDIGEAQDGKPFFSYLAYTAPHWPLQAPDEYIARHRGRYDGGYDAIQEARLQRMRELGLVGESVQINRGPGVWPRWDELSAEQKTAESRRMEIYAAMVDNLDHNVGRLVEHLKRIGQYDNTIFVFFSDNGAEGSVPEDIGGGGNRDWIRANFDNSVDNLGRPGSFIAYGPNWARVSATPFRMFKAYTYEGGIRVPAFVTYPGWRNGQRSDAFVHVKDVAPTVLELAGIRHPETYGGHAVAPMEGTSLLPFLTGRATSAHTATEASCIELFGRVGVTRGEWKLAYSNRPWGTGSWELFNLANDPTEMHDLSASQPKQLAELLAAWERYQTQHAVIWSPSLADKGVYGNRSSHFERAASPHP